MRGRLDQLLRRHGELAVAGERHHLQLAGALEAEDIVKGFGDACADDQHAVVAQYERFAVAEVAHHARLLVQVERHALVVVVADVRVVDINALRALAPLPRAPVPQAITARDGEGAERDSQTLADLLRQCRMRRPREDLEPVHVPSR